jgi:formylmethanofuran dehydrogenase subunit E
MDTDSLTDLLETSAGKHRHLCPRQVLGARMGLAAGEWLGLDVPQTGKRLLAIVETDGCAADGVSAAANCWVGRRTMRIEDYGKVAATFVDIETGRAVRLAPRPDIRDRAGDFAPEAHSRWEAQLLGYQRMPTEALLSARAVRLKTPVRQLISRAGQRAVCENCGEEILNEREVLRAGLTLCRACAGDGYYRLMETAEAIADTSILTHGTLRRGAARRGPGRRVQAAPSLSR